ncbi:MAG: 30S ribosomal protein S1 [Candidatus Levybacteria bacterium]|nr:30S ribosomal protein S1 [Candidatus Levybacteria bacterium]
MAELLAAQKTSFVSVAKGAIIPGVITKLTPSEILVDINTKAEAVVLEKDKKILNALLSSLSVGDRVTVQILNPESEMGFPVVSLRRFLDDKLWKKIIEYKEKKEVLEITVNDVVRGGFLVSTSDGISGFLPNSQVSFASQIPEAGEDSRNLIGQNLKAIILETDRTSHKIIFSQSHAIESKDFDRTIRNLKRGQKIEGMVTNVSQFGLFILVPVDENQIDGFVHISDVSWNKISDLESMYKSGDSIEASITGIDKEARRINLSIKVLEEDPFKKQVSGFSVDKKIKARIEKISATGLVLDLGDDIKGIIRKDKIPPNVSYREGEEIDAVVSLIDEGKRRIILVPALKEKPIGYR